MIKLGLKAEEIFIWENERKRHEIRYSRTIAITDSPLVA